MWDILFSQTKPVVDTRYLWMAAFLRKL